MSTNQGRRPAFYEGQYLGANDLTAAVDYGRIEDARHALGAHTWGIAAGLQLIEKDSPAGGGQVEVFIQPGYAWDGFGRPIVVLAPTKISPELFKSVTYINALDGKNPPGRLFKIWLRYDEAATQTPAQGFGECGAADQFSRIGETFRIETGEYTEHESHNSISVAGYSLDARETLQKLDPQSSPVLLYDESVPYQDFPIANPKARWLVPLGVVRWLPNPTAGQPGNFVKREQPDLDQSRSLRRYIGVVAAAVEAADGVVRLRNRTTPYSQVLSEDLVWVEGSLRVEGDVKLFGRKLDFLDEDGHQGKQNNTPLSIARALRNPATGTDLQVVIGQKEDGDNRFVVGPMVGQSNPSMKEKLVVMDNGRVGIGTATPVSTFQVAGDFAFDKMEKAAARPLPTGATMCWNDGTWLRLNQNLDYGKPIQGVHTPGLFAPGSLNVGGLGNWGDPGFGNVWVSGSVGIGTTTPAMTLDVQGDMGRDNGPMTLHLWGARVGDVGGGVLFLRAANYGMVLFDGYDNRVVVGPKPAIPMSLFHVEGGGIYTTGTGVSLGGWGTPSDLRLKKEIEPLTEALDKLLRLRGVRFFWQDPEKMGNQHGPQTSLIAQEVEEVLPEWVVECPDGQKALTFKGFEAMVIEALRELKTEIDSMKARLEKVEKPRTPARKK